jgi:hypothetical protein
MEYLMKKDYYPSNEASLTLWCENFKTQFSEKGESLGFTAEEITETTGLCDGIVSAISNIENLKAQLKEQTEEKNNILETSESALRTMVKRIKTSPAYSEATGKLMDIVSKAGDIDESAVYPEVKLSKTGTGYEFGFSLRGYFDAVAVFRKNPGESEFVQVGIDMKSPYKISPPSVSGVEYYFQYLKNDEVVGLKSDIIIVEL